jgi:hypothetical protein
MSIRRIKPNIRSERFDESREFYCDVIGLASDEGLDWILFFSSPDDPKLQLSVMKLDVTAGVHPDVTIEVDDVDVRRFFVRDPQRCRDQRDAARVAPT